MVDATECRNQVTNHQSQPTTFFCLVMKEYLQMCPLKCPYFLQGNPTKMADIYQHNFELECPFLHLMTSITSQEERYFVCGKTGQTPNPQNCP